MNVNELRFGNYVIEETFGTKAIVEVDIEQMEYSGYCDPIPLTEQWLIDFGFEFEQYHLGQTAGYGDIFTYELYVNNWRFYYARQTPFKDKNRYQGHIRFELLADGGNEESGSFDIIEVAKHVHQLQNLYFALTGEELKKGE